MKWKYFKESEFACRHCGRNEIDWVFVEKLDQLRAVYGAPLVVTSGYRCPDHNRAVSSTGATGPHTTGRAVDLNISRAPLMELLEIALTSGHFTGVGLNQKGPNPNRFLHLDDLPDSKGQPRPTIWTY